MDRIPRQGACGVRIRTAQTCEAFPGEEEHIVLDPIDGGVRLQSRLDLLAIRELVKVYL
ncbi:MAG: hypothetical protein N2V71_03280 [Methanophagales archaeon]|nr:hypothetical protein [Methanophagales archaeon]